MIKVSYFFLFKLYLYIFPQILNYIEIWRVGWPCKCFYSLLSNQILCGLGGMNRCSILLEIELLLPCLFKYTFQVWKHIVLQYVGVFQCVYTPTIAPKLLFFLTCSTRHKVQLGLTIVSYSCICMYLLLPLSTLPNRSLAPLWPSFLITFCIQKVIHPNFAITKCYFFPISFPMCFAKLHSFGFHGLG